MKAQRFPIGEKRNRWQAWLWLPFEAFLASSLPPAVRFSRRFLFLFNRASTTFSLAIATVVWPVVPLQPDLSRRLARSFEAHWSEPAPTCLSKPTGPTPAPTCLPPQKPHSRHPANCAYYRYTSFFDFWIMVIRQSGRRVASSLVALVLLCSTLSVVFAQVENCTPWTHGETGSCITARCGSSVSNCTLSRTASSSSLWRSSMHAVVHCLVLCYV